MYVASTVYDGKTDVVEDVYCIDSLSILRQNGARVGWIIGTGAKANTTQARTHTQLARAYS